MRALVFVVAGSSLLLGVACQGHTSASGAASTDEAFSYQRIYAPGAEWRYETHRRYFENGTYQWEDRLTSVHTVIDGTPPREHIQPVELLRTTESEAVDLSEQVRAFPAYEVSLAPDAGDDGLQLPDITGWDMQVVGAITDLHTFLVAVSPAAGTEHLAVVGDSYSLPDPQIGSWANGSDIPVGEDCIVITSTLEALDAETAVVRTSFQPPTGACLTLLEAGMSAPVVEGTPNNFQQQWRSDGSTGVMWGREQFVVTSTLRRSDGAVLRAHMENELDLRLRVGCSDDLTQCDHEMPFAIRREVSLTLIESAESSQP